MSISITIVFIMVCCFLASIFTDRQRIYLYMSLVNTCSKSIFEICTSISATSSIPMHFSGVSVNFHRLYARLSRSFLQNAFRYVICVICFLKCTVVSAHKCCIGASIRIDGTRTSAKNANLSPQYLKHHRNA